MRETPRTVRVYVASLALRKKEARDLAQRINEIPGYEVVSTWHTGDTPGLTVPKEPRVAANRDLREVRSCDVLVVLAQPVGSMFTGGGHCSEFGAAAVLGKKLCVVGDLSNIFYHLDEVTQFRDADHFVSVIRGEWQYAGDKR